MMVLYKKTPAVKKLRMPKTDKNLEIYIMKNFNLKMLVNTANERPP